MPFDPANLELVPIEMPEEFETIIADLALKPLPDVHIGSTVYKPAPVRPPRPGRIQRLLAWLKRRF